MTTVWTRRLAGLALLAWTFSGCSLILDTDSLKTGDASVDSSVDDAQADAPLPDPGITVKPTQGLETTEGGGQANFTMVLDAQPTATVRVAITSSDETNGTVSPSQLTFTAINWDTPQTVTVTGQNDDAATGNQTYQIRFSVSSGDADYDNLAVSPLTITHVDDDQPGVTVAGVPSSPLTTYEDQSEPAATIEVYINTQPTAAVTVTPTGDVAEGTITPSSLVFAVGEFGPENKKTFSVKGKADGVVDGDQTYDITFASTSSDSTYEGVAIGTIEVTNVDEDQPSIVADPTEAVINEGATRAIAVTLGAKPAVDVGVAVASSNTGEGTVSPARLTFTTANWADPQTVTVTARDADAAYHPDVIYQVTLTAEADGNPYHDETAQVAMTSRDLNKREIVVPGAQYTTFESGGSPATIPVTLGSEPSGAVTVTASIPGAGPHPGLITSATTHIFTSANWNLAWNVTVDGEPDGVANPPTGERPYTLRLAVTNPGDAGYTGVDKDVSMITEDDGKQVERDDPSVTTIAVSGTTTFTINLSVVPIGPDDVEVQINLAGAGSATVTDPPSGTVALNGTNWQSGETVTITGDGAGDVDVTFTVTSDDDRSYDGAALAEFTLTVTP